MCIVPLRKLYLRYPIKSSGVSDRQKNTDNQLFLFANEVYFALPLTETTSKIKSTFMIPVLSI